MKKKNIVKNAKLGPAIIVIKIKAIVNNAS